MRSTVSRRIKNKRNCWWATPTSPGFRFCHATGGNLLFLEGRRSVVCWPVIFGSFAAVEDAISHRRRVEAERESTLNGINGKALLCTVRDAAALPVLVFSKETQEKRRPCHPILQESSNRGSAFSRADGLGKLESFLKCLSISGPPLPDPSKSTCRLRTGISSNPRRRLSLPGFSVIVFPKTSSLKIKQSPVYIPCCRALSYTVHNTDGVKTSKERNGAE